MAEKDDTQLLSLNDFQQVSHFTEDKSIMVWENGDEDPSKISGTNFIASMRQLFVEGVNAFMQVDYFSQSAPTPADPESSGETWVSYDGKLYQYDSSTSQWIFGSFVDENTVYIADAAMPIGMKRRYSVIFRNGTYILLSMVDLANSINDTATTSTTTTFSSKKLTELLADEKDPVFNAWLIDNAVYLQILLDDAPTNPSTKFLNGLRQWVDVAVVGGGGGYQAPLYITNLPSFVAGYKQIAYERQEIGFQTDITLRNETVLVNTFLFEGQIDTTTIDSGNYIFASRAKIDSAGGNTRFRIAPFLRHANGSETVLFTFDCDEITYTSYQDVQKSFPYGTISCVETDRFGFRLYLVTASTSNKTVNLLAGDGYPTFLVTPARLRHNRLRDLNGDEAHLHITQTEKALITSTAGIVSGHTEEISNLQTNSENYKTYSGFENRTDSTISINQTTGVFTLATTTTSFNVWTSGTGKHVITTTQTKTIVADQTISYLYIDENGVLQLSTTPWNIKNGENAPCSIIFKDGTHYTITDERHSYDRNREWHNWAHSNIGTMYHHGLVGTFTNTELSVTQGVIADEDITFDTLNTKTKASLWYRNGASGMRMVRNSATPYSLNGATIQYDNGSGTLQPVGNNKYTCSWVYCANDSEEPIYVVIGQNQYNTQTLALSASGPIINLSTAEWKLLYKVIYQNKSGIATYVQTVDYRTVQTGVATTPVTPTSHANLTERDAANSHPATAISVTTPSGYTSTDVDGLSKEIIANLNNASGRYYAETVSAPANAGTLTLKNATETVISTTLTNSNSFAIALPTAISDGKINESILIFKVGATLPTLTQPSGVVYRTEIPTIAINQTWTFCYEMVTYDNGSTFETYVSATKNV